MANKKTYQVTKKEVTTTIYEVEAWNPAHAREVECANPNPQPTEVVYRVKLVKPLKDTTVPEAESGQEHKPRRKRD